MYSVNTDYTSRIINTLILCTTIFVVLLITGTLGYMYIEDANWFDALYMTVITGSTVGFHEIFPLSVLGKLFTMFIIFTSIGLLSFTVTRITTIILEGDFTLYIKYKRMEKKLASLNNHVIICGYGRLGHAILETLHSNNVQYVIVEKDPQKIDILDRKNIIYIEGNATNDKVLDALGIERARAFVATLPSDAENVFVVLSAREKNKNITIYSRASDPENVNKLKMAGANEVILPEHIGGAYIANKIANPHAEDLNFLINIMS